MSGEKISTPTYRGSVVGRRLAKWLATVLYSVRVEGVEHVPPAGPVILAPNHTGFLDAPLLMASSPRPVHMLGKKELFRGPLGWVLRGVGQIPLDREDPGRALLRAGTGVLNEGRVLVVFPEGRRGEGDFTELRNGLAWFAMRSGAPVVPVMLSGTGDRGISMWSAPPPRARLEVIFGRSVRLPVHGTRTRSAVAAATDQLREALRAHHQTVLEQRIEER